MASLAPLLEPNIPKVTGCPTHCSCVTSLFRGAEETVQSVAEMLHTQSQAHSQASADTKAFRNTLKYVLVSKRRWNTIARLLVVCGE